MTCEILGGGRPAQDIPIEERGSCRSSIGARCSGGASTSRLPAESNIRFVTPTVWEAYRPYIIAIAHRDRGAGVPSPDCSCSAPGGAAPKQTVLAREATIRAGYDRIRQLAGRLINAQEAARASIARDLHDDVCQELVGVSLAVGRLKGSSGQIQDAHTQQALSKIHLETLGMFEGIRRLSHDLHPATLRLVGLATALRAHCVEVEKRHGVACNSPRTATRRPRHRYRPVFLPHRAGVASQRRRARRGATTLGLARQIGQ